MSARKSHRPMPAPPDWMDAATVAAVKDALRCRPRFRDGAGPIDLVQTHISSVLLTAHHVFKFKRAVDVGFTDFRSLASRRHFCREEVRLNRRLAPGVYLGVTPLRRVGGAYSLGRRGRIVDYCVVMRRLATAQMMDARLRAGTVRGAEIDALAGRIARFHRGLRPARRFAEVGSLATWRRNWAENFAQTEHAVGTTHSAAEHEALRAAVADFLRRYGPALRARVAGGYVRNGHGDLRCEHIELGRRIRIIDCVEFTERFRYGDVANDTAFLLMDLCHFGYPGLAERLLARYVKRMGDPAMLPLVPFYACYRAYVRGKVLGMRLQDRNLPAAERAAVEQRARRFFALARAFARQMGPPVLLIASGLMGSGKSHLAGAVAACTGMAMLASDRIRKELAAGPAGPKVRDHSAFGAGLYSAPWTERTYAELFRRAEALLAQGRSVILDATFSAAAHRRRAFALARACGAQAWFVECRVPDDVALARLRGREIEGRSISDGRAELYPAQKAAFAPVRGLPPGRHVIVDTNQPKDVPPAQLLSTSGLRIPEPLFTLPAEIQRRPDDEGGDQTSGGAFAQ